MSVFLIGLAVILLLFRWIYNHFQNRYQFWKQRNVPYLEPRFPVGNVGETLQSKVHFAYIMEKLYKQLKHHGDYVGIFFFRDPVLMVLTPEFAKTVLVKDFNYFIDRGVYSNERDDPLSANLFFMEGPRWRKLRAKLTPTFTSGRLKAMFHTILAVGEQFDRYLREYTKERNEVEVKDLLARFTTDIIGSCAFGIDCNSLENPQSKFREMGKRMINFPKLKALKLFFAMMFRDAARRLRIRFNDEDVSEFFFGVVRDTIAYREKNNVQRKDFMQLLIDLKNKGFIDGDNEGESGHDRSERLTFEEIAAQAFVFFFAGFETSATTMTCVLYLLAKQPEIQEKGRRCVIDVLNKHHGKFSYEALAEMSYIDWIIQETLRMYPPVATLHRVTSKPYKLPNGFVLPEGTGVLIPNLAFQRDPKYFPEPLQFRPERFMDSEKENRPNFSYLAFGEGPRVCIGMRFGLLQTRMGIALLLRSYRFRSCPRTATSLEIDPVALIQGPAGDVWLGIDKIYWIRTTIACILTSTSICPKWYTIPNGKTYAVLPTVSTATSFQQQDVADEICWNYSVIHAIRLGPYSQISCLSLDWRKSLTKTVMLMAKVIAYAFRWFQDVVGLSSTGRSVLWTFGACCSPSTAQHVKNLNARRFEQNHKEVIDAIIKQHYVDDILVNTDTEKNTEKLAQEVKKIYKQSKSATVMANLKQTALEEKNLNNDDEATTENVLGMWRNTTTCRCTFKLFSRYDENLLSNGRGRPKAKFSAYSNKKNISELECSYRRHAVREIVNVADRFSEDTICFRDHLIGLIHSSGQTGFHRKMWIYLLITVISLAVWYVRNKYSYWERNGVPFMKPRFPFGNLQAIGRRVHSSQLMTRFYREMKGKHPFGGIFFFTNPVALALDLEFVKNVLVRDFQYFHDRGMYYNEKDDPISAHLFNIEGTKWTNLRKKLIPTFSSGKIKMMCPMIVNVADRFRECVERSIAADSEVEMKDLLARFTTDVIGTCAFGIDCNSLNDPDVEFRKMGKKVFELPSGRILKFFFMATFKDFAKKIHIKGTSDDVSEFFFNVVRETIEYREKNNVQRNDFMNLLIQLKEKGELDDSGEKVGTLSLNEVVAQAFVFFLGGFETSSTTMSYCLYELSLNEHVQDKARQCVRNAIAKHGGLNYEAVTDMDYIEQCINESLRKYPPGANLIRSVTKDYQVPNSDMIFKKGMAVMIPVYAIHHDEEYYPDPERYDPERFSAEGNAERKPFTFIPFGEGPRICIAARFGMLEAKVGLATLLLNFSFSRCSKSVVPLVISPKHAVLTPAGGLWLKVDKL
ncbi:uncharacterized protein LOC131679332 [Topomyia yanbarensis]|uniref:uncharacterized protein LOC131679332 n=1 Tax=Topomyia yanbarensis TaxID=2498891 RepID=UPI00273B1457|nr:uncharacterized protein LOC131679332 [Topomyia yanbarensis]